jgi:hypothetical protein
MKARLDRLEQRSRREPAPVRFTIRTGEDDDEDAPGTDDQRWRVRQFTIRLDHPNVDEERADA